MQRIRSMLRKDGMGLTARRWQVLLASLVALLTWRPVQAWVDLGALDNDYRETVRGGHVLDGSFVMNVSELHINITNHGLIGSQYTMPSSYADAPSAQWPAGTGVEFLWSAGIWIGAIINGQKAVSTGQYEREFRPLPEYKDTIYEAIDGRIVRPPGSESRVGTPKFITGGDDDLDGRLDEEILDGYDNDDDGLIDEDFGQAGDQMMVCTMYDNTTLAREIYPDHTPLNLKVVQGAYAWSHDDADDFVGFQWDITNIGAIDLEQVYIGMFVDCDVGRREAGATGLDDHVGFWEGYVRASDNSFVPVSVAYMFDGNAQDPVPGYFGVVVLDYTKEGKYSRDLPTTIRVRSFNSFVGHQSFAQGGDPTNDQQRYDLMARPWRDPNSGQDQEGDYRYLVASGPWRTLPSGQTLKYSVAMVAGRDLDELLRHCAEAGVACYGRYFDLIAEWGSGKGGRETKVCLDEFPLQENGESSLFRRYPDWWDMSCVGEGPAFTDSLIGWDMLFEDDDGRKCIYVNMDNCAECERLGGQPCTEENRLGRYYRCKWTRWNRPGCTGVASRETQYPWLYFGLAPPTPPGMRTWSRDRRVHIYWDDHSEHAIDQHTGELDFESYRIYRAAHWDRPHGASEANGPESELWEMIAQYDLINDYYVDREIDFETHTDTLALGMNTGFDDIIYRPACLDDPRFAGLADAMQNFVDRDTTNYYTEMPALRDKYGNIIPGREALAPWEGFKAELDTFFETTSRRADPDLGIVAKRGTRFYEYVDRDLQNGFLYFYSVVATDHEQVGGRVLGYGLDGDPRSSFETATPGFVAQTPEQRERHGANIYVFPNPATSSSLAEFQQMDPNAQDPTGVRVAFVNLPQARNHIDIFTLDGDLVAELDHDGTGGYGQVTWNLVSRNGQQVVSGVYLYVVHSEDSRFADFIGKFVIIR